MSSDNGIFDRLAEVNVTDDAYYSGAFLVLAAIPTALLMLAYLTFAVAMAPLWLPVVIVARVAGGSSRAKRWGFVCLVALAAYVVGLQVANWLIDPASFFLFPQGPVVTSPTEVLP